MNQRINKMLRMVDMESAALDRRLAEQAIFRQSLDRARSRYRLRLMGTAAFLSGAILVWVVFGCPALHELGLCVLAGR